MSEFESTKDTHNSKIITEMKAIQIRIDTVGQNVRYGRERGEQNGDDAGRNGFQEIGSSHIAFACQYHWGKAKGHNVGE